MSWWNRRTDGCAAEDAIQDERRTAEREAEDEARDNRPPPWEPTWRFEGRPEPDGILVHPVNTDVLTADLSRMKELKDDSQLWKAILHVLGSKQQVLMRKSMVDKDDCARDAALGVGMAIVELDRWRKPDRVIGDR